MFRRFGDGEQPPPGEPAWIQTVPVDVGGVQIPVNRYFADHPGMVLGELAAGGARRADDLQVIAPAGTDVADGLAQALAGAAAAARAAARRGRQPRAPLMDRPPEGYQQARPDGTFARITDGFFEPFDPPGGTAGRAELRALLGLRDTAMALLDAELATTEDTGLVDDLRADLNARYDAYVAEYGPVNRHTRQVRFRDTRDGRALRERLLAEGQARMTGGKLEISDPAVRDRLVAAGHATVTGTGELRFGRTAAARAERQRLLDSGQARAQGGTLTLTEAGRDPRPGERRGLAATRSRSSGYVPPRAASGTTRSPSACWRWKSTTRKPGPPARTTSCGTGSSCPGRTSSTPRTPKTRSRSAWTGMPGCAWT